jgi:hypothetical protein
MLEEHRNKSGTPDLEPGDSAGIKVLVQRFRVCREVYPLQILATEGIRKIGFDLELCGTPECGTEHISPGCQHCQRVETALQEIADWIMQRESPSCTHIVSSDGASLSYAQMRANRPDVVVRVFMAHRHEWDKPIDECLERCLKDIEQALTELGVCMGRWSEAPDVSPVGNP